MFRIGICLALLMFADAAATPVSLSNTYVVEGKYLHQPPPLTMAWGIVETFGDEVGGYVEIVVRNVYPVDEGRTWIIDANNAADYGLDFQRLDDVLDDQHWRLIGQGWGDADRIWGTSGAKGLLGSITPPFPQPRPILNRLDLDRLEFTLNTYQWSDVPNFRGLSFTTSVVGNAWLAPEPSSFALIAMAGLYPFVHRRRHRG